MSLPRVLLLSLVLGLFYNWSGQSKELAVVSAGAPASMRVSEPARAEILLFGTTSCTYCIEARHYFDRHGIYYFDYRIDESTTATALYQRLGGGDGVPFLVRGNRSLTGFNPNTFEAWRSGLTP